MAVSIDHHDITAALNKFHLEVTDYYLEFAADVIYMYWVACPADVDTYIKEDTSCLAIQIKGKWIYLDEFTPNVECPFVNCRYILETN
jgi:hypothetical protein